MSAMLPRCCSNKLTRYSTTAEEDDPLFARTGEEAQPRDDLQTFIFSATLSKDLQHNLKRRKRVPSKKSGKTATALGESSFLDRHAS